MDIVRGNIMKIEEIETKTKKTVYDLTTSTHNYFAGCTLVHNSDLLIQATVGKKIVQLNASELIEQGYLVQPKIFFLRVPAYPGLKKDFRTVYNIGIVYNDLRNELIAEIAKLFVEKNMSCLIAVKEVKHGMEIIKKLKKIVPSAAMKFIQGSGTTGKAKMKILQELNEKKLQLVVATTVFGEGINIPTLDTLINAKAAKSATDTLQLYGRTLRCAKGKKKVIIVDLADQTMPYLKSHTNKRCKMLAREKNFIVKKIKSLADIQLELEGM